MIKSKNEGNALVSIIMPVYNVEAYVGRSIKSVLSQTYPNFELLVVDDGSLDSSFQVALTAMGNDGRCRLFHQENGGVSSARNRALDEARGDYIMFVDPDDWIPSDALRLLVEAAIENEVDVVISKVSIIRNGTEFPQKGLEQIDFSMLSALGPVESGSNLFLVNYFLSRSVIKSARFDESVRVLEDVDFIYRVCKPGTKYAYLNAVTYYYLVNRPGSALTELSIEGCRDTRSVRKRILLKEMHRGRAHHSLNAYTIASFGLLRRIARDRSAYYSACQERIDVRSLLGEAEGFKSRLYRCAVEHPQLMRPCFVLLGFLSRKTRVA